MYCVASETYGECNCMPKVARYVQEAGPMLYSSNKIRKTEKTELFVKI